MRVASCKCFVLYFITQDLLNEQFAVTPAVAESSQFDPDSFQVMSFNLQYRSKRLSDKIPGDPEREARVNDFLMQLGGCRKKEEQTSIEHFDYLRKGEGVCPLGYVSNETLDFEDFGVPLISNDILHPIVLLTQEDTGEGVAGFTRVASCEWEITKDMKRQRTSIYVKTAALPASTFYEDHSLTFFNSRLHDSPVVVKSAEVTERLEIPYDAYEHFLKDGKNFTEDANAFWTVRCAAIAFVELDLGKGSYQPLWLASAHLTGGRIDDELMWNSLPASCRGSVVDLGPCNPEQSLYLVKKKELIAIDEHMSDVVKRKGLSLDQSNKIPRILGGDMNSFPASQVEAAQGAYYDKKLSSFVKRDVWLKYQTVPDQAGTLERIKFSEEEECVGQTWSDMPSSCLNKGSTTAFGGKVDHFFTNRAVTVNPQSLKILHDFGIKVQSGSTVEFFKSELSLSDHELIIMTVSVESIPNTNLSDTSSQFVVALVICVIISAVLAVVSLVLCSRLHAMKVSGRSARIIADDVVSSHIQLVETRASIA